VEENCDNSKHAIKSDEPKDVLIESEPVICDTGTRLVGKEKGRQSFDLIMWYFELRTPRDKQALLGRR
jgi:hypothetical protein